MERETIELVKKMIKDGNLSQEIAEKYCPELKESEDERIRKLLIEAVIQVLQDQYCSNRGVSKEKVVAWLEKQGEQNYKIIKGKNYFCVKTHNYAGVEWIKDTKYYASDNYTLVNQGCEYYCPEYSKEEHNNLFEEVKCDDCVEKQGEQKSVKFKPLFKVGDVIKPKDPVLGEPRIIKGIHPKFGYDTNNGILDFEFEDNWELVEQNPAWGEEDETGLTNTIIMLKEGASLHFNKKDITKAVDFLNSLKDRVQPQPKQEWGEEDEQYLLVSKNALAKYQTTDKWDADIISYWLENKLKSLRPQNTWKPSDEQMEAFKDIIVFGSVGKERKEYLISLYRDLQEL